jgi:RNA polymerase sigma factor (sigma-70 family)
MATGQINRALEHLRHSLRRSDTAALSDGQLLERFIHRQEEAAFETLVRRHGPMVLGVCRRVLGNVHDADDAFQATFLVLVRKAASVVPRERVGNWLYGVAYHTALKARGTSARRRGKERQVSDMPEPAAPDADGRWRELHAVLDQELSRLPDKYRVPIVLCDLEGKTRKEAARQLRWPEGTVNGRLSRGRAMLAKRLTKHGVTLGGGTLAALLTEQAAACSPLLLRATVKAGLHFATGAGVVSSHVLTLTEGMLKTMLLKKLKIVTLAVLTFSVLGIGIGTGGRWEQSRAAESVDADRPVASARHNPDLGDGRNGSLAFGVGVNSDAGLTGSIAENSDDAPRPPKKADSDLERIQGAWQLVEAGDHAFPATRSALILFTGNWMSSVIDGQLKATMTFTLDPNHDAKWIDITAVAEGVKVTLPGIYELQGDQLKFSYAHYVSGQKAPRSRPKNFEPTDGPQPARYILKRLPRPTGELAPPLPGVVLPAPLAGPQPNLDPVLHAFDLPPTAARVPSQFIVELKVAERFTDAETRVLTAPRVCVLDTEAAFVQIGLAADEAKKRSAPDLDGTPSLEINVKTSEQADGSVMLSVFLTKNSLEKIEADDRLLLANSMRANRRMQLGRMEKFTLEKDAKGNAVRWLEVTVKRGPVPQPGPNPPTQDRFPQSPKLIPSAPPAPPVREAPQIINEPTPFEVTPELTEVGDDKTKATQRWHLVTRDGKAEATLSPSKDKLVTVVADLGNGRVRLGVVYLKYLGANPDGTSYRRILQSLVEAPLDEAVKFTLERDAKGQAFRWVDVKVTRPPVDAPGPTPSPAPPHSKPAGTVP